MTAFSQTMLFVNENIRIASITSVKFVPKGPLNNISALDNKIWIGDVQGNILTNYG